MNRDPRSRREPLLKRPIDLLLAGLGLVITAPLWPLIAILVVSDGGGSVFYRQLRWGKGARKFWLYKFRTMHPSDDLPSQATEHDERITRAGRVLRSMGLDELPQLLSILRGDMSLIGPRALAVGERVRLPSGEVVEYEELPGFEERLTVRPGLTGWATVYLPKDVTPLEKFEADLRYIREQSLALDIRLILLSVWISLRGRWESRAKKF